MKAYFLTTILLISTFASIAQKNYTKYCNTRFQFCIDYPSNFAAQPESDNGDGKAFVFEKAEIRAYGSLENEETNNLAQELEYVQKDYTISYKVVKKDYFIVSGTDKKNNIFYRKTVVKQLKDYMETGPTQVLQTLTITYPKSQVKTYENYCKKIATSFQ